MRNSAEGFDGEVLQVQYAGRAASARTTRVLSFKDTGSYDTDDTLPFYRRPIPQLLELALQDS